MAWAQAHKLDVKAVERVEKDAHGEKGVGLSYVDHLAARLRLEPWQLLVEDLDADDLPQLLNAPTQSQSVSFSSAALALAQALATASEADRDLISQQVAHLLRFGPSERVAKALDALTSVNVVIPPMGDKRSATDSERVELHSPRAKRATEQTEQHGGGKPWDSSSQGRSITPPKMEPGSQPVHRVPGQSTARKRSAKP